MPQNDLPNVASRIDGFKVIYLNGEIVKNVIGHFQAIQLKNYLAKCSIGIHRSSTY
jgi:hypothetical protein